MKRPLTITLAAFALVAATVPVPSRKLGKTQKIERYGYSIRILEDWTSIPAQPGETTIVGSWKPDQEEVDKRGDWAAWGSELRIVRFPGGGPTTGGEKAGADDKDEKEDVATTKGVEDYLEDEYEGARLRCTPTKFKAGSAKRKLHGELLEFTKGSSFVLAVLFKEQDWEWGIFYEAHEDYYEKEFKKVYLKSLKTFRVFEAKGAPVYTVPKNVDKSKLSDDQLRESIKAGIAGNPGWWGARHRELRLLVQHDQEESDQDARQGDRDAPREGLREAVPADQADHDDLHRARVLGSVRVPPVRRPGRFGWLLERAQGRARAVRQLRRRVEGEEQEVHEVGDVPRGVPPVHPLRRR